MFLCTVCGAAVSVALVAGVSLVSMLCAGDWARVSTSASAVFQHIATTVLH